MEEQNPLRLANIYGKLEVIEAACHDVRNGHLMSVPEVIARDAEVRNIKDLPPKKGIGSFKGQARLLHDLASIELQAMEMGFRSLLEYPEAPEAFRDQLVDLVLDEARHLKMCLEQIQYLGFEWGDWPVHTGLWQSLSTEDSLLDRLFIVHRYLEGSGLDASDKIQRRLEEVADPGSVRVVKIIADEEVGHVQFGSHWYREICKAQGIASDRDFQLRCDRLYSRLPRRLEPIHSKIRQRAGFSEMELHHLRQLQQRQLEQKMGAPLSGE